MIKRFNAKKLFKQPYTIIGLIAVFGFVGIILTISSHAATYSINQEAEAGQISGKAVPQADTGGASAGHSVLFGTGVATPTPTPSPSPSGQAMPSGDLAGWKQIFAEDFTKDAATGSWGSECDGEKIVYTGATGTKWRAYPNCFKDTYQGRPYRSDQVLSVHNGVLDFFLHQVAGQPAGANPSPVIAGTSQYQVYGRYEARFKVDTPAMSEYYAAWLLWPDNDADWQCAESDFPEGGLDENVGGFAHYGCSGSQDSIDGNVKFTDWHTYTQEWLPGVRKYYIDGKLVGTSTKQVYAKPQRWQLQTETNGNGAHSGHLLLDWAVVYSRS